MLHTHQSCFFINSSNFGFAKLESPWFLYLIPLITRFGVYNFDRLFLLKASSTAQDTDPADEQKMHSPISNFKLL
jgi:hypothetical protein